LGRLVRVFLTIVDGAGIAADVGSVKIGQFSMADGQRRADIPREFENLDDRFFSLGQDNTYYENLSAISERVRQEVLAALRDVALDNDFFARAMNERVTGRSLLRFVAPATVTGQYFRLARGGARVTHYAFGYSRPATDARPGAEPLHMSFEVRPASFPPTNIHVLIGPNGVGKTTILNNMTRALVEEGANPADVGSFANEAATADASFFANLISVTFSAFDPFDPIPTLQDRLQGVQYAYIGLKATKAPNSTHKPPKTHKELTEDFVTSVNIISRQTARLKRWLDALRKLEADPLFRDEEIASLASQELTSQQSEEKARSLFGALSSGHKIVLLTITRLVETVEEKTLVLLDEPEAHLHPPLLSAFIRSLSDLLIDRNGVAVIATHSPVVVQEVPKSCVWKIRRTRNTAVAERSEIETFGENVGVLTREVFGLEVTHSGFHKMISDVVANNYSYAEVVGTFDGELGGEARALIRALLAAKLVD
jgi:predicted ATPase